MSNGVNGSSTVSTNQEFLREIALNSYGYGSKSGEAGGRGNIGLVRDKDGNARVVKFNTSWFTYTPKVGSSAYEKELRASNRLRRLLVSIAQTSDLPPETMKEIRNKLGVGEDNNPLHNVSLLERKVTAAVVKMIDKDIWTRVKAESKKTDYSTKGKGWSADEKDFFAMAKRIKTNAFAGSAVALDQADTTRCRIASEVAHIVENAVEGAQGDRRKAVGFGTARTFEGAVQDAAADLKGLGLTDHQILVALDEKKDEFLELAALASGKQGENGDVRAAFAGIRKAESEDVHKAGLMRKTLANLLVSSITQNTSLAHVTQADIATAQSNAMNGLPAAGTEDYENINTINSLSKTVFDPAFAPDEFSRAFTTPRQRADAVAILTRLGRGEDGWKNKAFLGTALAFPLVHKAVTEARKFQPDDKPLTDESIYAALVGKLPADNGNKDLLDAVDERVTNDFSDFLLKLPGVPVGSSLTQEANNYVLSASLNGLKYDSIIESLRHPGWMPTVHDFFDASIRPKRQLAVRKKDDLDSRYREFASRRVASRYYFKGPHDGEQDLVLDSQKYFHKDGPSDVETANEGKADVHALMGKFKGEKIRQMVSDLLVQDIGEPFFITMFGTDVRYKMSDKGTAKYLRALRNFSDFTFTEEGEAGNESYRLVVTPNREYLRNSNLNCKDVDYELEFLIDHDGNAWVTKQWFGNKG